MRVVPGLSWAVFAQRLLLSDSQTVAGSWIPWWPPHSYVWCQSREYSNRRWFRTPKVRVPGEMARQKPFSLLLPSHTASLIPHCVHGGGHKGPPISWWGCGKVLEEYVRWAIIAVTIFEKQNLPHSKHIDLPYHHSFSFNYPNNSRRWEEIFIPVLQMRKLRISIVKSLCQWVTTGFLSTPALSACKAFNAV